MIDDAGYIYIYDDWRGEDAKESSFIGLNLIGLTAAAIAV